MERRLYLIESSQWSSNGAVNPVVHAVIYATRDSLAIRMLDFLQKHVEFVMDRDCEKLDVTHLTDSNVDARLVKVLHAISDSTSGDISFNCSEWGVSYRIRAITDMDNLWRSQHVSPNQKVVLGVEFKDSPDGDNYDFETTNLTVSPEPQLSGDVMEKNPQLAEMLLELDRFSIEGLEW